MATSNTSHLCAPSLSEAHKRYVAWQKRAHQKPISFNAYKAEHKVRYEEEQAKIARRVEREAKKAAVVQAKIDAHTSAQVEAVSNVVQLVQPVPSIQEDTMSEVEQLQAQVAALTVAIERLSAQPTNAPQEKPQKPHVWKSYIVANKGLPTAIGATFVWKGKTATSTFEVTKLLADGSIETKRTATAKAA